MIKMKKKNDFLYHSFTINVVINLYYKSNINVINMDDYIIKG